MNKAIRTNLAFLRFSHGRISQRAVSEATGIGQKTLSSLETGSSKGIEFKTLLKLCAFFNCTPGEFLLIADEMDDVPEEVIITEPTLARAKELVAQGLQAALQSPPRSADEIWSAFDAIRAKIQSNVVAETKRQEKHSA